MSHAYTGGMPTWQRRRRRAVILTVLALVLVAGVIGALLASGTLRGGDDSAAPGPTASPRKCPTPPAGITVNVLNATTRTGVAANAADTLRAQKFTVGEVTNAPSGTRPGAPAEIRYGGAGADGATLLARYVPGATLVEVDRVDKTVDLVIGERFDGVRAPKSAGC